MCHLCENKLKHIEEGYILGNTCRQKGMGNDEAVDFVLMSAQILYPGDSPEQSMTQMYLVCAARRAYFQAEVPETVTDSFKTATPEQVDEFHQLLMNDILEVVDPQVRMKAELLQMLDALVDVLDKRTTN